MTISITGASGDIGGAFLLHVASASPIKALVRKGKALPEISSLSVERFDFQCDHVYDTEFLRRFTDSDAVLHCAGLLNVDGGGTKVDYFAVNALLTGLLVVSSIDQDPSPKFVYISTEMVHTLSASEQLSSLRDAFVKFCRENFLAEKKSHDLRKLAEKFIEENKNFQYDEVNVYALTKYLGEAILGVMPGAAIIRVTSAYGPVYDNPRLISRLMVARLTGRGITYPEEKRDFVYSEDINRLLDTVIEDDLAGIIDCKSGEITDTRAVSDAIVHLTPTAYGVLTGIAGPEKPEPAERVAAADVDLSSIIGPPVPLATGLVATMNHHKRQCYHEMVNTRSMDDFLQPGERIIEELKGGSSAYIYVVADKAGEKKVRKVAIRDGVEGNGLAKIVNEINYYRHIEKYKPQIAKMYPRLLEAQVDSTFSSETIEYLDGLNYYATLRNGDLPITVLKEDLQRFINTLCAGVLENLVIAEDPENSLDVYYVERALSRLQPIYGFVDVQDTIRINGRPFRAPHIILTELLSNRQLRSFLMPRVECFCFHGDLTLLNTVLLRETHEIRMVDPRGYTGDWDPLYDFGKLKFTLSGFGEFILNPEPVISKTRDGYEMDLSRLPALARKLNDEFLDMLADSPQFSARIIGHEPHWRYRIRLAEATHYLADIPFRLFTDETPQTTVANYIVGTYCLNQLYDDLRNESGTA